MRKSLIGLVALLLLGGCYNAEQPRLDTEPGISLTSYKTFVVAPAANETGQSAHFNFARAFTQDPKRSLQSKGYSVVDGDGAGPDTLIVQSSFISYEAGNAFARWMLPGLGESQATVKTTLVDKKSGQPVADVVMTEVVTEGLFGGVGGYRSVLQTVATDVATAIDNKIKGA